jgi:hypothetical protein
VLAGLAWKRIFYGKFLPIHHPLVVATRLRVPNASFPGSRHGLLQRQLGHSSITLTVDRYGRWERNAEKAEAEKLEGAFPVGTREVRAPVQVQAFSEDLRITSPAEEPRSDN